MNWIEHAIWWQVFPLGFSGAPIRPSGDEERTLTHRLRHLTTWLDHAQGLGVNGLQLGPVFTSSSHGYDTLDFFSIDPRLGDDADFDALVAGCRERGINMVLDGVFNHVGDQHPAFLAALAQGPDCEQAKLFRIDWSATPPRPANFEGHGSLVTLDHESPAVADLVVDVMLHWLRRGIAGWRLDAAYAIAPEFWQGVVERLRAEFPEAWFVGEMIHGDYADYVRRSGLDSITQYELWKSIWSSLEQVNFFELDWTLGRHNAWLDSFLPLTFVGNHDVTRIASKVGPEKARLAAVLLFTLAGTPSIYYGDERGYTGVKTEGWSGDDEVRPMFPGTPGELSPLGEPMMRLHQDLIALRRRNPWLARARSTTRELRNEFYSYSVRGEGDEELFVTLALQGTPSATISDPFGTVLLKV